MPTAHRESRPWSDRSREIGAVALAGTSLTLLAWMSLGVPGTIVLALVTACALQGLGWGGLQLIGMLAGSVLALALGGLIAPMLDGLVSSTLNTHGMQTRMISVLLAMLVITLAIAWPTGWYIRRQLHGLAPLARWNGWLGAGLGAAEGLLLGMAVLWTALALEPVARARLRVERGPDGGGGVASDQRTGVAGQVVRLAEAVRGSALGPIATNTSPLAGSELLALAEAFAAVSRSEKAMRTFLDHSAMREIESLPSVVDALARLKQDATLRPLFERGSAVSAETLLAIMQSDAVVAVLDEGSLVRDLSPRLIAIRATLDEARRVAEAEGGG